MWSREVAGAEIGFHERQRLGIMGGNTSKNLEKAVVVVAVVLVCAMAVNGQERNRIRLDIPYAFIVQGKQLPAGTYSIERSSSDAKDINVRSIDGKNAAFAAVATWLKPKTMEPDSAEIVFDVAGDRHILAEVWIPGLDGQLIEGFLPQAEKHTHEIIKGKLGGAKPAKKKA